MSLRLPLIALAFATALVPAMPAMPAFAHGTAAPAMHSDAPAAQIGEIAIAGAFTRATLPNAPVAGGFFTVTNNGAEDDRLVSAASDIAKETQIHEMAMEGDVMKMRQLDDGLAIPAGEVVALAPGGFHIMFMGLNTAIAEGDVVPLTLTFEKAGTVTVELVAGPAAAAAPASH